MQTIVYRGREISRLMNEIKEKHGEDAVIVSTKEIDRNQIEVQVQISNLLKSSAAKSGVLSSLPIDTRFPLKHKFVALIGSTGVGKTTTIAKIAARMNMAFDMKIGLISADYYRVGASQQLETYAKLMRLPYRSINDSRGMKLQLEHCLAEFKHFDLVLIDAAGFSPNQDERVDELSELFSCKYPIEKFLVLPAPGNEPDLLRSVQRFSHVGFDRLVISKLDESGYVKPVLSAAKSAGKPLVFITNGQRVPEDIEPASHRRIVEITTRTVH